jgi:hypothetical protein
MQRLTFEEWKQQVNRWVWQYAGLSLNDLPDCCYADWYDAGTATMLAARRAIREAKAEGAL